MSNVPYTIYGSGEKPLLAFHGYGMDGTQFSVLENSLCQSHKVYGFHMPYHRNGPEEGKLWIDNLIKHIRKLFPSSGDRFSLIGYSLGSKVALRILEEFPHQVDQIYLLAPYGLESHAGLDFVSQGWGNKLFKVIVKTSWPERIMKTAYRLKIINSELKNIILEEMNTRVKRLNLCLSLKMVGSIHLEQNPALLLQTHNIPCTLVYGKNDFLFPYHKRNNLLDSMISSLEVLNIEEGHWMVTTNLDRSMMKLLKAA